MKQKLALLLSLLLVLSLTACGSQPQAPESTPPASESAPDSQSAPPPESSSAPAEPSQPEIPAVFSAAPGVEYKILLPADRPDHQTIRRSANLWAGRLLAEVEDSTGSRELLVLDLETGEQVFSRNMDDYRNAYYEYRQSLAAPEEFFIFTQEGCCRFDKSGEPVWDYALPEAARAKEESPFYGHRIRWDVRPEQDLLAWTDPEGIWLSDTRGQNPRLVLPTEEIAAQPVFAQLAKTYEGYGPEGRLGFMTVRLMDSGRVISATFGSPQAQNSTLGQVILNLSTGKAAWYDAYGVGFGHNEPEYLDDTTVLANVTQIDVTTGETRRAPRDELTERFFATTGDFVHYYGVEETDTAYHLVRCTMENWEDAPPSLTVPRHPEQVHMQDGAYTSFFPFAADGNKVVCYYETSGREGLLLVTIPE